MTIQRVEHVGIVVDYLAAATAFFLELGLKLEGEGSVEGGWVDRVVGLEGVRSEIAMMENPDGHGRLELTSFLAPSGQGGVQKPLEGVSFASTVADANADTGKETQFYSMLGTGAIWHRGWKAATAVPACPAYWGSFDEQRWELFDTNTDPSECHDLAEQHPDKLKELIEMWWAEAKRYQALPLETRTAVEAFTTPRPQLSKPRDQYIYHADGAAVPESVAPNIRGRSYTIAAELDVDTAEAGGVLFEQGSRFGGHALYIHLHQGRGDDARGGHDRPTHQGPQSRRRTHPNPAGQVRPRRPRLSTRPLRRRTSV